MAAVRAGVRGAWRLRVRPFVIGLRPRAADSHIRAHRAFIKAAVIRVTHVGHLYQHVIETCGQFLEERQRLLGALLAAVPPLTDLKPLELHHDRCARCGTVVADRVESVV